jgi:RHS repeat-associated protein
VVAETMSGALAAHYVRGDDLLSVIRPDGSGGWQTRFYHSDYIGSVRRLTDETGTVRDEYEYSAFGELLSHTGSDPQPYAFTGEPLDPNTGWQYHRARWMDPRVGRFAGMDQPRGESTDPTSLHRYTYGHNRPTDAVDPSGLTAEAALLGTLIHQDIKRMYPGDPGNLLAGMIPGLPSALFPDIADTVTKEVIEIKPLSASGMVGWHQLSGYILALNYVGALVPRIGTGWHEGLWTPDVGLYTEPTTGTRYQVVGNVSGVLFYWVPSRRVSDRVWRRIGEALRDQSARARMTIEEMSRLANEMEHAVLDDVLSQNRATVAAYTAATAVMIVAMATLMSSMGRFAF